MIKKLSLKFVLVFLVLVVSVFITSACYASTYIDIPNEVILYNDLADLSAGSKTLYPPDISFPWTFNTDTHYYILLQSSNTAIKFIAIPKATGGYYIQHPTLYADYGYDGIYVSSSYGYYADYNISLGKWDAYSGGNYNHCGFIEYSDNFNWKRVIWASEDIYAVDDPTFCLYSTKPDTSFDYSFEGVKRGQTKLSIDNLNTELRMYGYVGLQSCPDGEILDTTANIENLRLLATKTDNSDLYCYLSEGEELIYYIVDENNVILDVGYISEMAKGYFLYGFKVNDGVDFVFLKNGQVYWDNNLIFKYKNSNSNTIQNNDIVSMGQYSYIEINKTVASGTYTGYVYDVNGSLLSESKCNYSNNLSSLAIEVDTSYHENNVGWNKSCYWLHTIYLTGNNIDGTSRDFSNYSVRWSIPTWLILDSLEVNGQSYDKRSGILTGFTSNGVLSLFNLKIYELIKNHKSSFDITLQVYDSDNNLVLTHIINSDDIVQNQVSSEENNVDKGDYEIVDNPNYSGGSNSNNIGDINNIQNWTADDYLNLMSTDNFIWEFFKAILGNLPWWITTPLTILIFGVVIITIIRFARGA